MAILYGTTRCPSKLEAAGHLAPAQPWYRDSGAPEAARVGAFRLDDSPGGVGTEFMAVADGSGERATAIHPPMTCRAGPLDGICGGLIGH
jgi:hypothetical protein